MLENLVKKSLATLTGIAYRLVEQAHAMQYEPVDGIIKYDMVIKRVDEDGNTSESKDTYKTALSRQLAAQQMADQSSVANDDDDEKQSFDDQSGITSLVFEDRLPFWLKSAQTPTIPKTFPKLIGKGKLVLRFSGKQRMLELVGASIASAPEALEMVASRLGMHFTNAAIIRRHVAFKRTLMLRATK